MPSLSRLSRRRPARSVLEALAAALLFALLTAIVTWPQPAQWLTHTHGHHDALFSMWRLAWIADALTTEPSALFNAPIFHPELRTLAYSDAVLLQGLLATPALAAGAPVLPVYNVLLLAGPWLSALGAYLLVRSLTGQAWPAVIAGTVFGLLPYRIEHAMHLELQWSQWMPLTMWALHRTVRQGRAADGVLTGVFVLLQFVSCVYYGVFLLMLLTITTPVLLLVSARAPLIAVARALLVGAVIGAAPLVAYSAPYRANQQAFGGRGLGEIDMWSATPGSFLSSPLENRLYGSSTSGYGAAEGRLMPGVLALLLAILALIRPLTREVWVYAVALVSSAVLALGTHTPAYRIALILVPPLSGLRAPARFGMLAALAVAVLAGFGAAWLLGRIRHPIVRHAVAIVIVAGMTVEYASRFGPLHPWLQRAPMYAAWLRTQPPGTVVDLPLPRGHALPLFEAEWSYLGRTHGKPMANGYSGYYPRSYLDLLGAMTRFPNRESLQALRARDVRYVVVHEDRYKPADFFDFLSRLYATPGVVVVGRFGDPEYPAVVLRLDW